MSDSRPQAADSTVFGRVSAPVPATSRQPSAGLFISGDTEEEVGKVAAPRTPLP